MQFFNAAHHAPVMDAILPTASISLRARCFNPRARDGRDNLPTEQLVDVIVSIHAPVMDAMTIKKEITVNPEFQSTRP